MKRRPFAKIQPAEALIYWAGAAYLLLKAAYDGFAHHNAIAAAGDLLGIVFGAALVWLARFLWARFRPSKKP